MKKRVLAIGAHPDDIEIGCGGTMALLSDQGHEIKFVIITSGEEGGLLDKDDFQKIREGEAQMPGAMLGACEIEFLKEPDGLAGFSKEVKLRLIKIIRAFRPEMTFIHSTFDNFQDHKIVSELSRSAIQVSGGPWYPEAELPPHKIDSVFGFEVWNPIQQPQMIIDIGLTVERKIKSLECHKSQIANVDYLSAVRGLAEYRGAMTMAGRYAEAFEIIKMRSIL